MNQRTCRKNFRYRVLCTHKAENIDEQFSCKFTQIHHKGLNRMNASVFSGIVITSIRRYYLQTQRSNCRKRHSYSGSSLQMVDGSFTKPHTSVHFLLEHRGFIILERCYISFSKKSMNSSSSSPILPTKFGHMMPSASMILRHHAK